MRNRPLSHLHDFQKRILSALQSAVRVLQTPGCLIIIGSLGRFLGGENVANIRDIDVKIDRTLCERYWEFIESLTLHGIKPVYDIFDRPRFAWDPCEPAYVAHARALAIGCPTDKSRPKQANLDICISPYDLDAIPNSQRWVRLLNSSILREADSEEKTQKILQGRDELVADLRSKERSLANRGFDDELGLYFAW